MKLKRMWAGVFAIFLLASCSQDELETTNNNGNGEEKTWFTDVRLVMASAAPQTRGLGNNNNDGFDDGVASEYQINKDQVYFVLLDENKRRISAIDGSSINWSGATDGNSQDNVTQKGTIILHSTIKPKYVLCFLNVSQSLYPTLSTFSLEAMKNAYVFTGLEGTKKAMQEEFARPNGFVMSNSSHYAGNTRVQEVDIENYIYSPGEQKKSAVDIYMERLVAKVNVDVNIKNKKVEINGQQVDQKVVDPANGDWYRLSTININRNGETEEVEFGVRFLSWGLNATNRSVKILKEIPQQPTLWSFGSNVWNASEQHRTYWAQDGNYNSGEGQYLSNAGFTSTTPTNTDLSLNYVTLRACANSLGTTTNCAEYCFENTFNLSDPDRTMPQQACTQAIVVAEYVDKNGKGTDRTPKSDIYRMGSQFYTTDAFKSYILHLLKDMTKEGETITADEIILDRNRNDYSNLNDVKAIVRIKPGSESKFKDGILTNVETGKDTDITTALFKEMTIMVYPFGVCFYSIPIKHFANLSKGTTGYFGVVRNCWYQLTITQVDGFGHPTSPDKPIVPEPYDGKEYELGCNINVLSWAKTQQDVTVGSGAEAWE